MNIDHWEPTEKGWITEASTLSVEGQDFMPRGESYYDTKKPPYRQRWKVDRSPDRPEERGEILAWIYTYPDGKQAIVLND